MPAVAEFDLRPLAWEWINEKERRPRYNYNLEKTKGNEWYRGFYKEAKTRHRKIIKSKTDIQEEIVIDDLE